MQLEDLAAQALRSRHELTEKLFANGGTRAAEQAHLRAPTPKMTSAGKLSPSLATPDEVHIEAREAIEERLCQDNRLGAAEAARMVDERDVSDVLFADKPGELVEEVVAVERLELRVEVHRYF